MTTPVAAQIDYRNLDADRPTLVEDAFSIERGAFEFLVSYHVDRHDEVWTHATVPELAWGFAPGTHAGVKLPVAYRDAVGGDKLDLAGFQGFVFVNVLNETPAFPAVALRLDTSAPLGALAGDGWGLGIKALATRSFGLHRFHVSAGLGLAEQDEPAAVEGLPRWHLGLAVDRTLLRSSTLLLAEVVLLKEERGASVAVEGTIGLRRQLAPTLVLDAGLGRRLGTAAGPDFAFTFGLSHAFAIEALMPGGTR